MLGLAGLLASEQRSPLYAAEASVDRTRNPLAAKPGHFTAKAKHVIWIFINGGPSHVDTWDYKPELTKWDGKSMEEFDKSFDNTTGFFKNSVGKLMPLHSIFASRPKWENGFGDFSKLGEHVDKMAFIHSGFGESNNHSPALFMMNCGFPRMGFPCVGSWVTYGLGSESHDLPGFVVMSDPKGRGLPKGHASNWSSGFLPGVYQGTHIRPTGVPIDNLEPPSELKGSPQRSQLDLLKQLNGLHATEHPFDSELSARIESFELAFRMQIAAPEAWILRRNRKRLTNFTGWTTRNAITFRSSV